MKAYFAMNAAAGTLPTDLERYALTCVKTPAFFKALKDKIDAAILSYDPDYGPYMSRHLRNTSSQARRFLSYIDVQPRAVGIIADAFSIHDLGKIRQPVSLWALSKEKKERSAEEKQQRNDHAALGVAVLDDFVKEMNLKPSVEEQRFLELCKILMIHHHERIDGSGPHGFQRLDKVMRALTVIDQIDGKGKAKDIASSFDDVRGKHGAQFDQDMVGRYERFCNGQQDFVITLPVFSGIAKMGVS